MVLPADHSWPCRRGSRRRCRPRRPRWSSRPSTPLAVTLAVPATLSSLVRSSAGGGDGGQVVGDALDLEGDLGGLEDGPAAPDVRRAGDFERGAGQGQGHRPRARDLDLVAVEQAARGVEEVADGATVEVGGLALADQPDAQGGQHRFLLGGRQRRCSLSSASACEEDASHRRGIRLRPHPGGQQGDRRRACCHPEGAAKAGPPAEGVPAARIGPDDDDGRRADGAGGEDDAVGIGGGVVGDGDGAAIQRRGGRPRGVGQLDDERALARSDRPRSRAPRRR